MFLFAVFADMWQALTQDVSTVCKEIMEKQIPEKQTYMSLPRPGVSISAKARFSRFRLTKIVCHWTYHFC